MLNLAVEIAKGFLFQKTPSKITKNNYFLFIINI